MITTPLIAMISSTMEDHARRSRDATARVTRPT